MRSPRHIPNPRPHRARRRARLRTWLYQREALELVLTYAGRAYKVQCFRVGHATSPVPVPVVRGLRGRKMVEIFYTYAGARQGASSPSAAFGVGCDEGERRPGALSTPHALRYELFLAAPWGGFPLAPLLCLRTRLVSKA